MSLSEQLVVVALDGIVSRDGDERTVVAVQGGNVDIGQAQMEYFFGSVHCTVTQQKRSGTGGH